MSIIVWSTIEYHILKNKENLYMPSLLNCDKHLGHGS